MKSYAHNKSYYYKWKLSRQKATRKWKIDSDSAVVHHTQMIRLGASQWKKANSFQTHVRNSFFLVEIKRFHINLIFTTDWMQYIFWWTNSFLCENFIHKHSLSAHLLTCRYSGTLSSPCNIHYTTVCRSLIRCFIRATFHPFKYIPNSFLFFLILLFGRKLNLTKKSPFSKWIEARSNRVSNMRRLFTAHTCLHIS